MKKTLIALIALAGIASADWTNDTDASTSFTISGTGYASDYRLIMNGNDTNDKTIEITSTGTTTIAAIDGNGLNNIDSVTFNIDGTLTITDYVKLSNKAGNKTILDLGNTGSIILSRAGAAFSSADQATALTLNAGLLSGETERTLITCDYLKVKSLTLNITAPTGYTNGGLVYEYNGAYYSDVTMNASGYCTITDVTKTIELEDGKVYTVADIRGNSKASIKGLSLLATAPIPEPTTATLSLLALVGLAARRRRK